MFNNDYSTQNKGSKAKNKTKFIQRKDINGYYYLCDHCITTYTEEAKKFNFCPNCGRKIEWK